MKTCENCKYFNEFSSGEGYCEKRGYIVYWYEHCVYYDERVKEYAV